MTGPKYLIAGSHLTTADSTPLLRAILEGLNTQARQWSETITILDDGSLRGLEGEVGDFRHLEHRRFKMGSFSEGGEWTTPNIVIAFIDRLSHNRDTAQLLRAAESQGIPAFCISTYGV